jgi:hypothetical protein
MIIRVPDILIAEGGVFRSFRGGGVSTADGFRTVGTGCGVAKGGNWYVLDAAPTPPEESPYFRIDAPLLWFSEDNMSFTTRVEASGDWRVE